MTKKEIKLNLGVEEIVNLNNEGVLNEKTCFEALKKFDKEDLIKALLENEDLEDDLEDELDEDLDGEIENEDSDDNDLEEEVENEVKDVEFEEVETPKKKEIQKSSNEIDLDDEDLANILD